MKLNGRDYTPNTFRGDLFGGLTSAVVALPVALAFGVASGMGAAAGLYSVIAVGFFASVFGGTRSQISGPTGPMTIAMAVIITTHASTLPEALTVVPGLLVALVAGTLLGVLWLTDVPVIGPVPSGLPGIQLELPTFGFLLSAVEPAIILAPARVR